MKREDRDTEKSRKAEGKEDKKAGRQMRREKGEDKGKDNRQETGNIRRKEGRLGHQPALPAAPPPREVPKHHQKARVWCQHRLHDTAKSGAFCKIA
eukprot:351140-Chlamydomonas_euryale.AAC.38